MKKSAYKIHIIGAGVSGLIAAQVLENNGYNPVIIEASNDVGGRVKTDIVNKYQLDHGFQVLLTSYPAAQKYLNYDTLKLQKLLPGAIIFKDGKSQTIGDPLRNFSLLLPTLFSSVGSFSDKIKILKLNILLKKKSIPEIFKTDEISTLTYLQNFGFSDKIIRAFFKPFFTGIFLESNLETSSRMFEFVYKMFGDGLAVIPKNGMQAISHQLRDNLKNTEFQFNSPVKEVKNNCIVLKDDTLIENHFTIIATEASNLVANLKRQETEWKSCDTLYFETKNKDIQQPIIGLIADEKSLINNIFYHTSTKTTSKGTQELLSVTIVKEHNLTEEKLIKRVTDDLKTYCAISEVTFLKRYQIKKALPKLNNLQYEISTTETKLTSSIFLAGDVLLNGSLNAAIISGEKAAMAIIQNIEDGIIVDEL